MAPPLRETSPARFLRPRRSQMHESRLPIARPLGFPWAGFVRHLQKIRPVSGIRDAHSTCYSESDLDCGFSSEVPKRLTYGYTGVTSNGIFSCADTNGTRLA